MDVDAWLKAACDDADRRGLPELRPLLETLAKSTSQLREADRAARESDHKRQPGVADGPR